MPSKYWSGLVDQLDPYVPGEQPKQLDLIKLNTNENPYPPSPKVLEALSKDAIDNLRLYPDPANAQLKQAIAKHYDISEQQVIVGNGSDEVLAFAFQAFFKQDKPLLFPDITYGFYTVYCGLFDIDYVELPLADDFSINLDDYLQPNGGIIFPNPNAPTGIGMELSVIEELLKSNTETVVIVDEAYVDFGSESATALIDRYPNVLVIQTLSKSRSLAGARVGFAVGSAELIEGMERVKNSFNPYSLDRVAELAATVAIEDREYFNDCCNKIIATREWTTAQLEVLGFEVIPSKTNFVMAKPPQMSAEAMFKALREENIIVRYFSKARIDEYLRVSIGSDEEMQQFIAAVKRILSAS